MRRVVQQVAADPCSIRMKASRAPDGNILVETAPIQDCSGNAVPDGTIVTFTSVDEAGRSTVDARIKRGFARAELPPLRLPPRFPWPREWCSEMKSTGEVASDDQFNGLGRGDGMLVSR